MVENSLPQPLAYLHKISVLLKHNRLYIDSKLMANIQDVLQVMQDVLELTPATRKLLADGFTELQFWFGQGYASRTMPEILYCHLIRYVKRGLALCQKENAE